MSDRLLVDLILADRKQLRKPPWRQAATIERSQSLHVPFEKEDSETVCVQRTRRVAETVDKLRHGPADVRGVSRDIVENQNGVAVGLHGPPASVFQGSSS